MTLTKFVAVGGPNHAEELEDDGQPIKTVLVMAQQPDNPLAPPVALPTKYIKRAAEGEIEGKHYRRWVYVHESVSNVTEMAQLLANYLLGVWIKEGGEIVESPEVVPGGDSGGSAPVGPQPSRSASGLYLP
jgi:hypothetical protein